MQPEAISVGSCQLCFFQLLDLLLGQPGNKFWAESAHSVETRGRASSFSFPGTKQGTSESEALPPDY